MPTVLITGANKGLGLAFARAFSARGERVIGTARVPDSADDLASVAEVYALDVGSDDSVADFAARLVGATVDLLINNAGILLPGDLETATAASILEQLNVNAVGAFLCAREAVRRMSTTHGGKGGAIVNVSSAASVLGSPREYIDYAATKGAVDTMTIGLAKEVAGEGIQVNSVRPSMVRTDMTEARLADPAAHARLAAAVAMNRIADVEEIAAPILWLLSEAASFISGACLDAAGGGFVIGAAPITYP